MTPPRQLFMRTSLTGPAASSARGLRIATGSGARNGGHGMILRADRRDYFVFHSPNDTPDERAVLVRAHQEVKGRARAHLGAQALQRVDRVARRAGRELALVDAVARLGRYRELQHGEPVLGGGHRRIAVSRGAGRYPEDLVHAQLAQRTLRDRQVRVVNRVESAAEDADFLGQSRAGQLRISPWPSTTNFCVVRPSRPTGPRAWSLSVEMPISAPRPYS